MLLIFLLFEYYFSALVVIPLWAFHRITDEMGSPKNKVTILHMTARCCSTLLTQILSRVPNTKAFSEPFVLNYIHNFRNENLFNENEVQKIMKSAWICLCYSHRHYDHVVIKLSASSSAFASDLMKHFPRSNIIFMTRHIVDTAKSIMKLSALTNATFAGYSRIALNQWIDQFGMPRYVTWQKLTKKYGHRFVRSEEMGHQVIIFGLAVWYSSFYKIPKEKYSAVLFYEDLSKNMENEVKRIFKVLDIKEEHLPNALMAAKKDSQRNIFPRGQNEAVQFSQDMKDRMDLVLEDCNLPIRCNQSFDEFKKCFY